MNKMLKAADVAKLLRIGETRAYQIIKELNAELKAAGYYTIRGRISAAYFEKRIFGKDIA